MKFLITFPNGDKFTVPAEPVIANAKKYYAKEWGLAPDSPELHEQMEEDGRLDAEFLIDWIEGDMNWPELMPHATLIKSAKADYEEMLDAAEIEEYTE
jgi:hypothetical protein